MKIFRFIKDCFHRHKFITTLNIQKLTLKTKCECGKETEDHDICAQSFIIKAQYERDVMEDRKNSHQKFCSDMYDLFTEFYPEMSEYDKILKIMRIPL